MDESTVMDAVIKPSDAGPTRLTRLASGDVT